MTSPCLEACYFDPGTDRRWERLAHVLAVSAGQHCVGWNVRIDALVPRVDPQFRGPVSHARNTQKLAHWQRRVSEAADGQGILLIDADTLIVRPLDAIWAMPFDIAYTTKVDRFPFNAGVIFLRVSDRVRAFMAAWVAANARLMATPRPEVWMRQYGGVNQAALAAVLAERPVSDLELRQLPCQEWNCEDSTWAHFDPAVTRILHVKSALRKACFARIYETPALATLVAVWKSWDAIASPVPEVTRA